MLVWMRRNTFELRDDALRKCVQGWIQILGPVTANRFANDFSLDPRSVLQALLSLETQGLLMRGIFEGPAAGDELDTEWCERRILQRIHKLTIGTRRRQVEPVSPATFMQWLLGWQHLLPRRRFRARTDCLRQSRNWKGSKRRQSSGRKQFCHPVSRTMIPAGSISFVLSGVVGWGRVSPHPAFHEGNGNGPQRVIPTNAAPITFYLRDSAAWLDHALREQAVDEAKLAGVLTPSALRAWNCCGRGARVSMRTCSGFSV